MYQQCRHFIPVNMIEKPSYFPSLYVDFNIKRPERFGKGREVPPNGTFFLSLWKTNAINPGVWGRTPACKS